jgi:ribosomal protein S18 acetylase RimI-like enzyme
MATDILPGLSIRRIRKDEQPPYDLLLLADPSQYMINMYIGTSDVYVAFAGDEQVAVYALYPTRENGIVEIKNIAVAETYQGRGIGKQLLAHACSEAIRSGYHTICIGTANSSVAQLYLYQRQGFEIAYISKNFFITNYPEPIYENGIRCTHMITLEKRLG